MFEEFKLSREHWMSKNETFYNYFYAVVNKIMTTCRFKSISSYDLLYDMSMMQQKSINLMHSTDVDKIISKAAIYNSFKEFHRDFGALVTNFGEGRPGVAGDARNIDAA